MKTEDISHLRWIHDRFIYVYGENQDVDYLIKLRSIIAELEAPQSRSCEGCKHYKFTYNSNDGAVRQLMTICSDCFRRLNRDNYEPKE